MCGESEREDWDIAGRGGRVRAWSGRSGVAGPMRRGGSADEPPAPLATCTEHHIDNTLGPRS